MKEEYLIKNPKNEFLERKIFSGRIFGKSKHLEIVSERLSKEGFIVKRIKPSK